MTLLAANRPDLVFQNWSGDLTGSTNPAQVVINGNKNITANFNTVNTYTVSTATVGIGSVTLSPAGGQYADGTTITVAANSVLNSTFLGWSGALSGTNPVQTLLVNGNKSLTANFSNNLNIDFHTPIGFASITADGFTGPTTGGNTNGIGLNKDTVYINGPAQFNVLCQILYDRIRYKFRNNNPLTIVLEQGTYTGTGGITSVWANAMLTIQEQANLTIIGRRNVILNFGINIKRSSNIIIRNITFQDYYDDGINIGETETHHIWVDHCTVGHPTTLPANTEHPDGGIDVKDGASYVTISWTLYRNSWKTGLVGHSDNNGATDNGRLKVTYFANHFTNTNSRNPRVRFGEVHVLNNLEERVMLYGIAASNNSSVYAENNFFLNTRWPMYGDRASADFKLIYGNNSDNGFTSKTGNRPATGLKQVGNEYDDSGLPVITSQINPAMLNPGGRSIKFDELNPTSVFIPSNYYSYTPFPAAVVRTLIPLFVGADKVDWFPNQALPLDFLSVDAKTQGQTNITVKVTWSTTNEVNTKDFEVQRRQNDSDFKTIGVVESKNVQGVHQYIYLDKDANNGVNYYQIKQNDKDGKYTSSKIVFVNIGLDQDKLLSAFPNPVNDLITINHLVAKENANVKVIDLSGRTIISKNIVLGNTQSTLNVQELKAGIYLLIFDNNGQKQTVKMVKN